MIRQNIVIIMILITAISIAAKDVDLVTLPAREGVQLTIYNSEDITLVKENRYLPFKKGLNKIQFSWNGTLIDPTSVEFRPISHSDEIEVAHTVFPGQKPQHLTWYINSEFEGQVMVEVSYFTSGLSWTMDYVAITNPDESNMRFRGYVKVLNTSGETYNNAKVRLIVGKINLVEKIRDLALRGRKQPHAPKVYYKTRAKKSKSYILRKSFQKAEAMELEDSFVAEKKKIVKEGLSEYFMFSIEGRETIKNGWSKRMQAVDAQNVKFDILYRLREHQYGVRPLRFFCWENDSKHGLGESPLPNGQVRIFRNNGKDGLAYLGEKLLRYVPIKAKIEVKLGEDDLVVYEHKKTSTKRNNFHFYRSYTRYYVDGWNEKQEWIDVIRNYGAKPIVFEIQRVWHGDIDFYSEIKTTLFDYRTVEVKLNIDANSTMKYPHEIIKHNGSNQKQNRIKLKKN